MAWTGPAVTTERTRPWTCSRHPDLRLLWRRTTVDCPRCGPLASLPSAPSSVLPMTDPTTPTSRSTDARPALPADHRTPDRLGPGPRPAGLR